MQDSVTSNPLPNCHSRVFILNGIWSSSSRRSAVQKDHPRSNHPQQWSNQSDWLVHMKGTEIGHEQLLFRQLGRAELNLTVSRCLAMLGIVSCYFRSRWIPLTPCLNPKQCVLSAQMLHAISILMRFNNFINYIKKMTPGRIGFLLPISSREKSLSKKNVKSMKGQWHNINSLKFSFRKEKRVYSWIF